MNKILLSLAYLTVLALVDPVSASDIRISYLDEDLNDDSALNNLDYFVNATGSFNRLYIGSVATGTDKYYDIGGGLKYDANQDGDLKDVGDYVLYTGMYIIDGRTDAMVRLAYHSDNITALKGTIVSKLKGIDYLVTKTEVASKYIELGPAITKTLAAQTTVDHTDAVVFTGTAKLLHIVDDFMSPAMNLLFIFDGASLEGVVDVSMAAPYDLTASVHGNTTVLDNYKVWKTSGGANALSIQISITDENQIQRISNNDANVIGYALAKVADDDIVGGIATDDLFLLSDLITISPDTDVDVSDTYFNVKFYDNKDINVRRVESVVVADGSTLYKYHEDYSPFLKQDITMTIVPPSSINITYATGSVVVADGAMLDKDHADYAPFLKVTIGVNIVDITPPTISDVQSTSVTDTSAVITWTTDEPSDSLVKYGTSSGSYTSTQSDPSYVTSHSIALTGLIPSTTYHYIVNSTDPSGNSDETIFEYTFTTTTPSLKGPDSDGDGWTDKQESKAGTNPYNKDTDGDGWWDSMDPNPLDPTIPEKLGGFLQQIIDLLRDVLSGILP